jgi:hypothetical protein
VSRFAPAHWPVSVLTGGALYRLRGLGPYSALIPLGLVGLPALWLPGFRGVTAAVVHRRACEPAFASYRGLGAQTFIAAIPASQHARSCSGVPPLTPTAPSTFPSPSLITIEPAPAISGSRVIWLTAATNAARS